MKKLLFIIPLLFINLSIVKADDIYISNFYDNFPKLSSIDNTIVDNLIAYYNNNYSSQYDNYLIYFDEDLNQLFLMAININTLEYSSDTSSFKLFGGSAGSGKSYYYDFTTSTYQVYNYISNNFIGILYDTSSDFTFKSTSEVSSLTLPSYSNLQLDVSYPQMNIVDDDIIPTYMSLTNGSSTADFVTIDMSQYEYVILSLKNYNQQPFNTTIYSQGRLCFTPVYNYGMTQKQNIISDSQTQGCTESYSSLTPVSIYIIQADIDNHSVYYIKRYSTEENIIKVPTTIFDVTYITSQNASNPTAIVQGRSYPVIPYTDLTDTANISTETGYISGQVCSLGDVNCEYRSIGIDISDLWTQPLKVLQSVWTSITSVFSVIIEFIMLIPSPLREFLVSAFFLSVILGVLKILL